MNESILTSVKKMLGLDTEYTVFDPDVIMHINSALSILHQVGASPSSGLTVSDNTTTWDELTLDVDHVNMVKTYIFLKVRLWFDPPTSSYALSSMEKQIEQLEWRLSLFERKFNPNPEVEV